MKAHKKREEEKKAFDQLIASIDNIVVTIKAKANEKGHLFKAVSQKEVALAIKQFSGTTIDEDSIVMGQIKELGKHTITIKKGGTQGKCQIIVEREK